MFGPDGREPIDVLKDENDVLTAELSQLRTRCERLVAALESIARAPAFDANAQSMVDLARSTLKALTAPPEWEWQVCADDYDRLWLAALALRQACKDRLPPGHYTKLDEECRAIDAIRKIKP